jgi:4-hydroxy-tetrahydrodipicolinate synthase
MKLEEMKETKGIYLPMATPFKENLEVDEEGLRNNTQFLIEKGYVNGYAVLIPSGSTGECFTLTNEERKRIFKILVEEANGKVPVIAGCNHTSTREVIELAKYAEDIGVDGLMIIPPYYTLPYEEMTIKFFEDIAREVEIGIMVYNNPEVIGADIPINTMIKLSEIENIVAYKDCTGSFAKYDQTTRFLRDKMNVIDCGGDIYAPFSRLMGRKSVISGFANFVPEIILEMYKSCEKEDYDKAREIRKIMEPLIDLAINVFSGQARSISMVKEGNNIRGLAGGPVRPPVLPLDTQDRKKLEDAINIILAEIN